MKMFAYRRLSLYKGGGMSPSCEIQLAECEEYAAQHGHEIVGVFTDDDTSASIYSTKPRLGYLQMLERLRQGEAEGVLCTEMSRLYRRLEELLELIHLAGSTSLRKIETTDETGYDLSTGEGIHNAVNAVNNAVLESRRTSDRQKRRKKAIAREGGYNGGPRPYGYAKDGMTVVPDEADRIHEAAKRLIAGESPYAIISDFNQRGFTSAKGGPWSITKLERILSSPRIIGVRTHNGREYPAKWPAIIERDQWEHVQLILQARREEAKAKELVYRHYLLTGFAECGLCEAPMIGSRLARPAASGKEGYLRYRCVKTDGRGVKRGCGKVFRNAAPVDALVTEAVLLSYESPEFAATLKGTDQQTELQQLLGTYHAQKLKVDDLVTDYASGLLNREQLTLAKSVVEDALEETKSKLERLKTGRLFAAIPVGQTIREAWETADLEWRRSLIGLVVKKVILYPGNPGRRVWRNEPTGEEWCFDPSFVEIVWKV